MARQSAKNRPTSPTPTTSPMNACSILTELFPPRRGLTRAESSGGPLPLGDLVRDQPEVADERLHLLGSVFLGLRPQD